MAWSSERDRGRRRVQRISTKFDLFSPLTKKDRVIGLAPSPVFFESNVMQSTAFSRPRQTSFSRSGSSYLEYNGKIVTDGESPSEAGSAEPSVRFELVACKCKSRFCPECAKRLGMVLRERLKAVLRSFSGLQMWTLTIDPTLFGDAEEAYRYVRARRSVAIWVRRLKEAGYLHSDRYFCAVEFHQSGHVHFHVLLDTSFVPFDYACFVWNLNRPAELAPVEGNRPGFGSVRFSKGSFANYHHAANYVCKYLTKEPVDGWPEWVLNFIGQVHRYQCSHGFWGQPSPVAVVDETEKPFSLPNLGCANDCFCDACRGEVVEGKRVPSTVGERLERCARGEASIIEITETKNADGVVEVKHRWVGKSLLPYQMALEALGLDPQFSGYRVPIGLSEVSYLRGDSCGDYAYAESLPGEAVSSQLDFVSWMGDSFYD